MPARPVLSDKQCEILFSYMEAHPAFARGQPCLKSVSIVDKRIEINTRWKHLTCSLNSVDSGCKKNHMQWREYWNNLKHKSQKQLSTIQRQLKVMVKNGVPGKLRTLTEIHKRVLHILGIPVPELQVKSLLNSQRNEQPLGATPNLVPPPATPAEPLRQERSPSLELRSESAQDRSPSVSSTPDSSGTISPLLENTTLTEPAWGGIKRQKDVFEPATSTTNIFAAPLGSPTPKSKQYSYTELPTQEWVRQIEERRIAIEERSARGLQGIQANTEFCASALQGIHIAQERMNRTLQGIQAALEATARAMQRDLK